MWSGESGMGHSNREEGMRKVCRVLNLETFRVNHPLPFDKRAKPYRFRPISLEMPLPRA